MFNSLSLRGSDLLFLILPLGLWCEQESLRESCTQVSTLQQREREREIQREREKEQERISQPSQLGRQKDRDSEEQRDSKLEVKLKELQDKGLVQLKRTASGSLDIEVVPVTVVQSVPAAVTETGTNQSQTRGTFSYYSLIVLCSLKFLLFCTLKNMNK